MESNQKKRLSVFEMMDGSSEAGKRFKERLDLFLKISGAVGVIWITMYTAYSYLLMADRFLLLYCVFVVFNSIEYYSFLRARKKRNEVFDACPVGQRVKEIPERVDRYFDSLTELAVLFSINVIICLVAMGLVFSRREMPIDSMRIHLSTSLAMFLLAWMPIWFEGVALLRSLLIMCGFAGSLNADVQKAAEGKSFSTVIGDIVFYDKPDVTKDTPYDRLFSDRT